MKRKILVIDDKEYWRDEIKRVFKNQKDIDYEIYEASNMDEARQVLINNRFDMVVIDMRLEEIEEGLRAIEAHRRWNPSAVPIVFTAYPSLQNCVKAMRLGAWDYIDKNDAFREYKDEGGNPIPSIQVLLKSAKEGLEHRFSPEAGPNSLWLQDHLPDLIKHYGGKVIAFIDEEVVGVEESLDTLKEKVRRISIEKGKEPYYMWVPKEIL
jgi:CheY-like chemotaxis protein